MVTNWIVSYGYIHNVRFKWIHIVVLITFQRFALDSQTKRMGVNSLITDRYRSLQADSCSAKLSQLI